MNMSEVKMKTSWGKPYQVTIDETVEYSLNKHQFGIDGYEPRNLTLNLVPPKSYMQQKAKRETFVVAIPKMKQLVPGPDKYSSNIDWQKMKVKFNQKANKAPVNSFITQIFNASKSPEKCTPSPSLYKNDQAWSRTSLAAAMRVTGGHKQKEERTTYLIEKMSLANDTPGPIYGIPNPVSFQSSLLLLIILLILGIQRATSTHN
jgi:hypothetical protein